MKSVGQQRRPTLFMGMKPEILDHARTGKLFTGRMATRHRPEFAADWP
jgi:hypothetical protein